MDWQKEVARLAKELEKKMGDARWERHQELSKLPEVEPCESKCELGTDEIHPDRPSEPFLEWRDNNAWLSRNS